MNDCQHNWLKSGSRLSIVETLDDWLGPTLAIVRCDKCEQPALINLIAWQGKQLRNRIYGIRSLTREAADTYLANINRDYCDLTRKTSETEALLQTAGPSARLLSVTLPELLIEASSSAAVSAPFQAWQDIKPEDFVHWREILTLNETN